MNVKFGVQMEWFTIHKAKIVKFQLLVVLMRYMTLLIKNAYPIQYNVIQHLIKSMIHQRNDVYVLKDSFLAMINHVYQQAQYVWLQTINIMTIGESHVYVILGM